MLNLREDGSGVVFRVRVQPRAARDQLAGLYDGAIKVRLTAPPVDGAANEALKLFLARILRIPRGSVELVTGHTGRNKLVRVVGLSRAQLLQRLSL